LFQAKVIFIFFTEKENLDHPKQRSNYLVLILSFGKGSCMLLTRLGHNQSVTHAIMKEKMPQHNVDSREEAQNGRLSM